MKVEKQSVKNPEVEKLRKECTFKEIELLKLEENEIIDELNNLIIQSSSDYAYAKFLKFRLHVVNKKKQFIEEYGKENSIK